MHQHRPTRPTHLKINKLTVQQIGKIVGLSWTTVRSRVVTNKAVQHRPTETNEYIIVKVLNINTVGRVGRCWTCFFIFCRKSIFVIKKENNTIKLSFSFHPDIRINQKSSFKNQNGRSF